MKSIKWYESKTVWLNVIATILMIAGMITAPDSPIHLGAKGLAIVATVTGVLNLILRLFSTSKPVEGTNAPSR